MKKKVFSETTRLFHYLTIFKAFPINVFCFGAFASTALYMYPTRSPTSLQYPSENSHVFTSNLNLLLSSGAVWHEANLEKCSTFSAAKETQRAVKRKNRYNVATLTLLKNDTEYSEHVRWIIVQGTCNNKKRLFFLPLFFSKNLQHESYCLIVHFSDTVYYQYYEELTKKSEKDSPWNERKNCNLPGGRHLFNTISLERKCFFGPR